MKRARVGCHYPGIDHVFVAGVNAARGLCCAPTHSHSQATGKKSGSVYLQCRVMMSGSREAFIHITLFTYRNVCRWFGQVGPWLCPSWSPMLTCLSANHSLKTYDSVITESDPTVSMSEACCTVAVRRVFSVFLHNMKIMMMSGETSLVYFSSWLIFPACFYRQSPTFM